jgi:hypothetical protein
MASTTAPIFVGAILTFVFIVGVFVLLMFVLMRGVRRVHNFFGSFLGNPFSPNPRRQQQRWNNRYIAARTSTVQCHDARCHAENPATARYCRRCGNPMDGSAVRRPAQARRVAMW